MIAAIVGIIATVSSNKLAREKSEQSLKNRTIVTGDELNGEMGMIETSVSIILDEAMGEFSTARGGLASIAQANASSTQETAESISIAKECASDVDAKACELSRTATRLSEEAAKWTM